MKRIRSLRRQLTLAALLAFSLLLGSGGGLLYWSVRDSLYEQFDTSLMVKAKIVMTNAQQQNRIIHVYFSDQYLREFDDAIASEFFQVTDMTGESVERSDSLEMDNLPIRHGSMEEPALWNLTLPNGRPGRAIGIRFVPRVASILEGQVPAEAIAVVASDRSRLISTLQDLKLSLWVIGGIWLALSLLSVPLVHRSILRPLSEVAGETDRIDTDRHGYRFRTEGMPAELQPITRRLNDFLDRLEESFQRERQFSSDIAHELKTPISELRTITEVAIKWPEESSVDTIRSAYEISLQMQDLVERLLELARSEQAAVPLNVAEVPLQELTGQILEQLGERMKHKGIRVRRKDGTDVKLHTDPTLLRSIVQNLMENAVEYGLPDSVITCAIEAEGNRFSLRIQNACDGLPETDLARMFDRLWRRDNSRTGPHSGLGLTLARSYAARLGMTLDCRLVGPDQIEFRLRGEL